MVFPRRPLALLICCGFAGAVGGPLAATAQAGTLPPLAVDPALLGLPPLPPKATDLAPARAVVQPVTAAPLPAASPLPENAPVAPAPAPARQPRTVAPESSADLPQAAPPRRSRKTAAPRPTPVAGPAPLPQAQAAAPAATVAAPEPAVGEETPLDVSTNLPLAMRRAEDESGENARLTGVDTGPGLSLRLAKSMPPLPKNGDARPTFLAADKMYGVNDRESVLEGNGELRRYGSVLTADKMTFHQVEDEVDAESNVVLTQENSVISGPKLHMKLGDKIGAFQSPSYTFQQEVTQEIMGQPMTVGKVYGKKIVEGRGQADSIDFQGEDHYQLNNATYTTCKPGNDDWYLKTDTLNLDYEQEVGEGRASTLYFKNKPIFYLPSMDFSLADKRQSGLLPPTFGSTSTGGMDITLPYYWNIAPNYDATLIGREITKRGLQLGTEVRYLNYNNNGTFRYENLANDRLAGMTRSALFWQHTQNFGYGLFGSLNINKVSDDNYFTDLSSRIGISSQSNLAREGNLSYSSTWWNAQARVLHYQTLQTDPANPVTKPYSLQPQLTLNARRPDYLGGTDVALYGQYTDFEHPTFDVGKRTVLYPQLSLPMITSGYYVTPKIGLHMTRYDLTRRTTTGDDNVTRDLPIFSVDAGATFERPLALFGRDYVQTLEPRLYYLNVKAKNQDNIPLFDTGLADFNFGQIFSENIYSGQDRIADANQLTAALTSRLVDPNTGVEYLKGMVGQRLYFRDQVVTLNPGDEVRTNRTSDFLAALSGRVLPKIYTDSAIQYNPNDKRTERFTLSGRYQPDTGKVLNAGYRFTRDLLKQVDFSGQWPLSGGWSGVGRYNYSIQDKRIIEAVGGMEYNGGCWVSRVVLQRYATTTGSSSTAFFVQLELNDFSRIGSNPLDILRRSIPGYGRINQPAADPVFGSQ